MSKPAKPPHDGVVEMDAMDVHEWEQGQRTPQASDANLAALVKQSANSSGPVTDGSTAPTARRSPATAPRLTAPGKTTSPALNKPAATTAAAVNAAAAANAAAAVNTAATTALSPSAMAGVSTAAATAVSPSAAAGVSTAAATA